MHVRPFRLFRQFVGLAVAAFAFRWKVVSTFFSGLIYECVAYPNLIRDSPIRHARIGGECVAPITNKANVADNGDT